MFVFFISTVWSRCIWQNIHLGSSSFYAKENVGYGKTTQSEAETTKRY